METVDIYATFPFRKGERIQFSSTAPFTPTYVANNLSLTSDPMGTYNTRVKGRQVLLENPARESRAMKALVEKRAIKKKDRERKQLGIIGKREAKEKGVWKFNESQAKYELFIPLHHLWMGYMSELLALPSKHELIPHLDVAAKAMPHSSGMHPKLLKADYHGSIMTVSQSKNPCLVGLSGIVIHETENAFKVVTQKNKVKLMPKQNSIFTLTVPLYSVLPPTHTLNAPHPPPLIDLGTSSSGVQKQTVLDMPHIQFDLYGNQFRFRAADRAGRKFKHKETIEL